MSSALRVVLGVDLDLPERERLRAAFPDVTFIDALNRDALTEAMPTADVLFGGRPTSEDLSSAPRLRWIQTYSAGVNYLPLETLRARSIVLTNASGAHAISIAENILAMMLAFAIRLPDFIRAQERREWMKQDLSGLKFELDGATLLIAGLGGIGTGLAVKAKGLGMRVLGIRNRRLAPPPGVDELFPQDQLLEALRQADHVALCLPLTPDTTGFLGEPELRAMRQTAYVYNVGRGKSIDREALLRALGEGWIAGAGLDVTDPEPLTPDDPLWTFPNVILSQHTSGSSPDLDRRVTDIFSDNLRRFLRDEALQNQVDFSRGY